MNKPSAPGPPSVPRSPQVSDWMLLSNQRLFQEGKRTSEKTKSTLVKEGPDSGALTGNGQVGVGLDLPRHVPGEALEHAGVVGQEAVHLQAASHQDPVPEHLHRVDGHGILVPHDVGLRYSCDRPPPLMPGHARRKA